MAAYCLFDITQVLDPAGLDDYRHQVDATVRRYGGRYLVRGGDFQVMEGSYQPVRLVILEFPDLDQARRWFDSQEYRPLRDLRQASARANAVFVEGL